MPLGISRGLVPSPDLGRYGIFRSAMAELALQRCAFQSSACAAVILHHDCFANCTILLFHSDEDLTRLYFVLRRSASSLLTWQNSKIIKFSSVRAILLCSRSRYANNSVEF